MKKNLVFLSLKFLLPITLCTIALCFGVLYNFTVSGMLSDEEIAKAVFSYNTDEEYVATEQFFDHKLFLQVNDDYLELKTADEVLNNRWVQGYSTQVQWNDSLYGYSIAIIEDDNDINNKGVVVFGKNKDAKTLKITFNNNVYTTFISPDEFFIITYPTFETLDENTTIYDIYSTGKSKDLKITFNEDDNIICNHMKYLR